MLTKILIVQRCIQHLLEASESDKDKCSSNAYVDYFFFSFFFYLINYFLPNSPLPVYLNDMRSQFDKISLRFSGMNVIKFQKTCGPKSESSTP